MKKLLYLLLLPVVVSAAQDWSRYEAIISRAPFGKEPPVAEKPVTQPSGTFAKQYRLCMLYRGANGQLKAGLVSKTDDKSMVLQQGEEQSGLSLVDVQVEEGLIILQKGNETAQLVLEGLDRPASKNNSTAVASALPRATGVRRVVRTGASDVSDQIRRALIDSKPKRARVALTKKRGLSGAGGAGRSAATRRPAATTGSSRSGGDSLSEVASAPNNLKSNGYVIQRVPTHINVEL